GDAVPGPAGTRLHNRDFTRGRWGDGGPASTSTIVIVHRHAAVIKLRPERRPEYTRLHAQVWPEVLAVLKHAHVSNSSIFLRDDYLFSYLEYTGENFVADMETVANDPATRRLWELTAPCQ